MNKYKHTIINFLIIIFCSYRFANYSADIYYGLPFDFNISLTIFNIVNFCAMANYLKTSNNSLFKNNVVNIIRYNYRRKALKFSLVKKFKKIISCSIFSSACIFVFELTGNNLQIEKCFTFCLLNMIVNSFLLLFQYYFELFINLDYGLLFINGVYITGILSGCVLHKYYVTHTNTLSKIAMYVNKVNLLNFTSLERINAMSSNIYVATLSMLILIVLIILLLNLKIKKIDILCEE